MDTRKALKNFVDKANEWLHEKKQVVMFLDFEKAFNTLNHDVLLMVMNEFDIRNLGIFLCSYFYIFRILQTRVACRRKESVTNGVPTGSIFGLFATLCMLTI